MKKQTPCIGLLTDFGLQDHYVGTMKAVMQSICPDINIVDIAHEVQPHNVHQAAYLVWASYRHFSSGSVIVAVVDPGVGGRREVIGLKTNRHTFLAPNNGVLDLVLWEERLHLTTTIRMEKAATRAILPRTISPTFHGRDIFAPVAAHLVLGTRLDTLGPKTHLEFSRSPFVEREFPDTVARVLHVDRFGNAVTNIRSDVPAVQSRVLWLKAGKRRIHTWGTTYESMPAGTPCLIVGSSGLVEIVMNRRSAASFLGLKLTDTFHIGPQDQL